MHAPLLWLPLALLLAAAALGAQTPGTRPQEAGGTLVLDAVVVDRDGKPMMDLKQDELEVWISGYRVPIETFVPVTPDATDRAGKIMVLLLDDMTLPPLIVTRGREIARRFVNRLAPGDQMGIVTLNGDSMNSTADQAQLLRRIDRWNQQAFGVQPVDEVGRHILNTVASLSRNLAEAPGGRKTIIAIGSGFLFNTPIPVQTAGRDLRPEWENAMRAAARANAVLYVIDPSGVGTAPAITAIEGFASYTGGHVFQNTNELEPLADRVLRETSNYYLLGVKDPPIQRKAELREVDVRVLRSGLTVRARRYIGGTESGRRR